jgi:hypothetical protein
VRPFTPKRYLDEYAGMAAGSGIPANNFMELNIPPEIMKAGCSILGVFGKATLNGDLIHLRALDWDPVLLNNLAGVDNLNYTRRKGWIPVGISNVKNNTFRLIKTLLSFCNPYFIKNIDKNIKLKKIDKLEEFI